MTDQDYVNFCDHAHFLRSTAETFFSRMSDEHLGQLGGLVRSEIAASPGGKVEPGYDFLATILAEEVAIRATPDSDRAKRSASYYDDLPF